LKKSFSILCLFALALLPWKLQATHIIGGEIYYDCLGNNQFRIVLKIYRDCLLGQAPFDDPAHVGVYNSNGGLVRDVLMYFPGSNLVPPQSINPCYQANANLCVEEAIYEEIITLAPNAGGYTLVYQRCCRNQSILNIYNPGDTGSTYTIQIPGSAFTECNSSPRFITFPPIVVCIDDPIQYSHAAIDPDGDSLVYYFCDPFEGASPDDPLPIPPGPPPYNFVNFSPPFSATSPLPSSPPASVNSATGFLNGYPTELGQYVVAVCVNEYRNGILLSTNKRDFQFNVVACGGSSTAEFVAPTAMLNGTGSICNGLDVNFINQSENGLFYQWDFGVTGTNTDISTFANPVYIFPDTGVYTVSLIVNPGYNCADTTSLQIAVYRELIAQLDQSEGQCIVGNSFDFEAQGIFEANADFFWEFSGPASSTTSSLQDPQNISYTESGTFPVYFTITTVHCEARDTIYMTVYPVLDVNFSVNDQDACEPVNLIFTNQSTTSPGAFFYWDFGDGTSSTLRDPIHAYDEAGSYTISLVVINTIGCIDTISFERPNYILIRPRPDAGIDASPRRTSILQPDVTFFNLSEGEISSWIYPGTGDQLFGETNLYTYQDSGWFNAFSVALNNQGCYDTAFVKVRIDPVFSVFFPNAFSPNGDGINEFFSPKGEGFKTYEMAIFDRWGVEIFNSQALNVEWDGRANNGREVAQSGVYNYRVWIRDVFNDDHIYTGYVVLIR